MKLKTACQILILILVAMTFLPNCHRFRIGKQYKPQPVVKLDGKVALIHENHIAKRFGFVDEKVFLSKFEDELKDAKGLEIIPFRESRKRILDAKLDSELQKINLHDPVSLKANPVLLSKLGQALGTENVVVVYSDEDAFPLNDSLFMFSGAFYYSSRTGIGRGLFHVATLIQLKSSELLFQEFVSSEEAPIGGPGRGKNLASILVDGLLSAKEAN
ncbi:hypothetical protein JWG44_09980 [Leptospira sp. 201903071]|uniref:hypothetical protein n=1 Tax=Leptospira ainazelensis TaxID=2810034 RepID=UPI0019657E02|nr:hypothetical protein [Leptospira ainazelensis]MBM9500574.1 hypothetical protein [Leptospira ainazelensis]